MMHQYYITRQSVTGIYGYDLLREQGILIRNRNHVLPGRQPVISQVMETGRELITNPLPPRDYPTVVPGLRVSYRIFESEYSSNTTILRIYSTDLLPDRIAVHQDDRELFSFYPERDCLFADGDQRAIAEIKKDPTFQYDPRSLDEARYTFAMEDCYTELLPYMFHAFVCHKLRAL